MSNESEWIMNRWQFNDNAWFMVVNVKNDHGWLIYGDNYLIIYYIDIYRERESTRWSVSIHSKYGPGKMGYFICKWWFYRGNWPTVMGIING